MKHWLNNLEIAKSDNWFLAEKYDFTQQSCELCHQYICRNNCPLTLADYNCYDHGSPYEKVIRLFTFHIEQVKETTTQEDVVGAISEMIRVLEEVNYE